MEPTILQLQQEISSLRQQFQANNFSNLYIFQVPVKFNRSINYELRVITTSGAVTVLKYDYILVINKTVGAATTLNLPANPSIGDYYTIKDGKGDAGANNITVTPAAGNIDGGGTYVMNTNYQSVTVVYNGTQWNII